MVDYFHLALIKAYLVRHHIADMNHGIYTARMEISAGDWFL